MIKKFSALFFAVFYLLISIGFSVSIHHCNGMNETSIALLETSSCCCDMEKAESDCCSNEEKVVQWEVEQQINNSFSFDDQLEPMMLDHITSILKEEDSEEYSITHLEDPPPIIRKPFLLFHQFTFYG